MSDPNTSPAGIGFVASGVLLAGVNRLSASAYSAGGLSRGRTPTIFQPE